MPKFALQLSLVKKPKTTNNEVPVESPDYVALAENAANRLAVKLVVGAVVVVATTVVLTMAANMAESAFNVHINN